jgi:hypothetical protein
MEHRSISTRRENRRKAILLKSERFPGKQQICQLRICQPSSRASMNKIDLKKELKQLYKVSANEIVQVTVPPLKYLMIDGRGDPNTSQEYAQAVEALFGVSYTAKFSVKKGVQKTDYAVMPLEGLWWADDMGAFIARDKANWNWTMMILQPSFVRDEVIREAISEVDRKKKLPALRRLRLEEFAEGRCAQTLHIGPFSEEGPTIAKLHEYIGTHSSLVGKHHEIYLTDIRRADPMKWKTILRQPMK